MIDWYEDAGWFDVIRKHPEKCRAKHQLDILGEFKGGPVFCVEEAAPIDFSIDKLKQISQPALVYNGSEDLPDFKEMAIILGDEILNVKRCVLEGLGGFPLWEDPVRVNSMVERFLNQL